MAIVINGSGTVTGLSVGGLPDGTVDAGTLATDSVVTGKIADGTIANADIADLAASKLTGALPAISGASLTGLTSSQMPAGTILQVVHAADTTIGILGSSSHTLINCPITPVQSNSSFILLATITHGIGDTSNNDDLDFGLQFTRGSVSVGGNPNTTRRGSYSGGGLYATDVPLHTADTTYDAKYELFTRTFNHLDTGTFAAGTAIPYKVMVDVQTNYYRNRALNQTQSGGQSSMIVMEVAT
jgi:hypothetical protein